MVKIGFGGGCHWCTEAIFQSLKGVDKVEQGWISSEGSFFEYSEAVVVHYDETVIDLVSLISIHLHTHSCTSTHALRSKYRSAVYSFDPIQANISKEIIESLQQDFDLPIITQVLPFSFFKMNKGQYLDYAVKFPESPFCKTYIHPKLAILKQRFSNHILHQANTTT